MWKVKYINHYTTTLLGLLPIVLISYDTTRDKPKTKLPNISNPPKGISIAYEIIRRNINEKDDKIDIDVTHKQNNININMKIIQLKLQNTIIVQKINML